MKSNNRISIRKIVLSAVAIACGLTASAVPAKPGVISIRQADGTHLSVQLRGDERCHYYLTEDNVPIINKDDIFYYAKIDAATQTLVPSDIRVSNKNMRTAQEKAFINALDVDAIGAIIDAKISAAPNRSVKRGAPKNITSPAKGIGLFDDNNFPAIGKHKALVVLVQYTDHSFTLSDPLDYFTRMLQENNFSDYGATGSAHDFFYQNSSGKFDPEFDVYGPITLSHNRAYYGGNDWYGNDSNPEQMVIEACQQLDETVDFSQYDQDGNGYIDNIFVFYAGRGEASGGGADTVWPHSWNVTSATTTPYYFDGVQLDKYGCSNEWEDGRPDGVGTFVHEFSHVLGIPDLYATSYTSAFTPGAWSAMDYGPYNNNGCTPPNYSTFERYALDWIEPQELNSANSISLPKISQNKACIIKTENSNEFFLIENRQQEGWDEFIPGHGMLVWHVDYDSYVWNTNTVNNNSSHQHVDIEEADNSQSEWTRDGDSFPGANNVTSFTDTTRPSMKTWSGKSLNLPITNIREVNGVIKFDIAGGRPDLETPVSVSATDVTDETFVAHWSKTSDADFYLLSVYTKTIVADREVTKFVAGYSSLNVGDVDQYLVEGLEPGTEYFFIVSGGQGDFAGTPSSEVMVTTSAPTFKHFAVRATDATGIGADSFTANWEELEGAVAYSIDVYVKVPGEPLSDNCDFSDGVNDLPSGWYTNSKSSYANTAYSGVSVPALRLSTNGAFVRTPTYDMDIVSIKFWHRGSNVPEANSLLVSALVNGQWKTVATLPVVNEKGGITNEIANLPEGTRSVKIEYQKNEDAGSLAIDDIDVAWGIVFEKEGLTYELTYAAASYEVTDLEPNTTYYYTVTASDGTVKSKVSNEIEVTTSELSGIISGINSASSVSVNGSFVSISAAPNQPVTIHDVQGRLLFSGRTDSSGRLSTTINAKGVYVLRVSNKASKIKI